MDIIKVPHKNGAFMSVDIKVTLCKLSNACHLSWENLQENTTAKVFG